ncbi:hypothetical protein [Streptomyces sp. NPDC058280]|uniref:hypothetical protein n=1 Tax=Streptomyces sp. NPDC058280 TaxID=3346419 RepID=UPI0036EBADEE
MNKRTLARHGDGWAHPYPITPFSPFLYADGGDGGGSGSGSGDGGNGDGQGAGDGDGGHGDGGTGTGDAGAGKGGKDGGADDSAATIARLEKELDYARKEAGKARTAAKQQAADDAVAAVTAKLGKALGFGDDDKAPTPEELTKALAERDSKLNERDAALRTKDVQLAVHGHAEKSGAKATALLDSRSFLASISELDPTAAGFGKALDEAIEKAVKANPSFATAAAGRSGGDLSGGTGEGATKRTGSLAGAIKDHYGN